TPSAVLSPYSLQPPPFLSEAVRFSQSRIGMGTLGLLAVLFAVLAMDRGPRVSSVQAQEAVACTPIVLDGDAIEPVSESVTASLPTATPSIDHTHAYDPEALA